MQAEFKGVLLALPINPRGTDPTMVATGVSCFRWGPSGCWFVEEI